MGVIRKLASWALVLGIFAVLMSAAGMAVVGNYIGAAVAVALVALVFVGIAGFSYRAGRPASSA